MLTIGNIDMIDASVGSAQVLEVWIGNQLVWPIFIGDPNSPFLTDEFGYVLSGIDPTNTAYELWLGGDNPTASTTK